MTRAEASRDLLAAIFAGDTRRVARLDAIYQRDAGEVRVITEARLVEVSLDSEPSMFPGCGVISWTTAGGVNPAALSQESAAMTPATGERPLRRQPDPT